jgi:hypothetical protein
VTVRQSSRAYDPADPSGHHDEKTTNGKTRGRHARLEPVPRRPRVRGRRRWVIAGAAALLWTGFALPAAGSGGISAVAHFTGETLPDVPTAWALPVLSEGAPPDARTLPPTPERVETPEPATPPVISGLAANGIPNVALNAYRVAEARMASATPSCGIHWSLLAGIGRVESNHGRYGGAALGPDGTSSPKILGPALNGVQFAYIGDSDGGQWDGDTRYDRAMGPMQFIPTTWRSYAIDGNGDGRADPFNINDAALAAASYLCRAGGNLRTEGGLRNAVFAYNHSDSYVAQVLALARAYASGVAVDGLPVYGPTTGAVPPPSGFYWAPAAPGPAIGSWDRTQGSGDTVPVQQQPGRPAGGSPAPAGQPAGGQPSGGQPTGGQPSGQPGTSGDDGGTNSPPPASPPPSGNPQPAPQPAPAPAPAPLPVPVPAPAPSVPAPQPAPPPAPAPAPAPAELIPGVTCNILGDAVLDIAGLPTC